MKLRIRKVIFFIIISLSILFGYYFFNKQFGFSIPCLFHEITGLYCPGCGITRCLWAILKGDFKEAFNYNQLVFIGLPFFLIYFLHSTYSYILNKENKFNKRGQNSLEIIILIIVIAFGIIRNLEGFEFLRPNYFIK